MQEGNLGTRWTEWSASRPDNFTPVRRIKYGVYTRNSVWTVKSLSNMVSASRVVAGGIVAAGILWILEP